ncbi:MAG: TolC family protein, partial [Bacteroidales bacterium]|nr:TolC family protein [Bacteroidales bacterium]
MIPLIALLIGVTPLINAQSPYSLEDCKELALKNNAQIKNARLEIEASKEVSKNAFTRYFPKVEMTTLTFAMKDPLIDMKIPGGNLPVYDGNPAHLLTATQFAYFPGMSFSLLDKGILGVVTATQPLYAGGRIRTGNQLSRLGIEVTRGKMALSENEVILKTEEQYWQIISLKEKMKTLMEMEQLLNSFYKQANDAWQAGLINRNDVMKVSLKQSDLRVNKLKLENGILLASMAFCQYLGLPLDTQLEFSDQPLPDQTPETLYIDP